MTIPDSDDMARFSDTQLREMRGDIDQLKALVEQNARSVQELSNNVAGVLQLYNDWRGTIRVGSALQQFCLWLLKWGVVGAGIASGIFWVLDHFKPPPVP